MKTLKPFDPKRDTQSLIKTFLKVFNGPPWNDKWTEETATDYLLDLLNRPGFIGFIGEENGKPFGFMIGNINKWWSAHEYYLNEMLVDTEHQRQGLGSFMIEKLKEYLCLQNIYKIILLTGRNSSAEAFYNKNGFKTSEYMILMSSRFGKQ